jgi:hypothetical protein
MQSRAAAARLFTVVQATPAVRASAQSHDGPAPAVQQPLKSSFELTTDTERIKRNSGQRIDRHELPLSTYFDPARIQHRYRHKTPKEDAPSYGDLDDFRKRVADSPYGRYSINQ